MHAYMTVLTAGLSRIRITLGKAGEFQDCITQSRDRVNSKIAWNIQCTHMYMYMYVHTCTVDREIFILKYLSS